MGEVAGSWRRGRRTARVGQVALHLGLAMAAVSLIWISGARRIGPKGISPSEDSFHYVVMAHNMCAHQVFSGDGGEDPKPTAYREPGLSAYHCLVTALWPGLSAEGILEELRDGGPSLVQLRRAQLLLLVAAALLAAYLALLLTQRGFPAYLALLLTGLSLTLTDYVNKMFPAMLTALLLLCVAIACYWSVRTLRALPLALLGLFTALLVLTKAVFMFLIWPVAFAVAALMLRRRVERRRALVGVLLLLGFYLLPVGAWMLRNRAHFGEAYITGRSGVVLSVRARYDTMNAREYAGAFLFWTPNRHVNDTLLKRSFGPDALKRGGALWRLRRAAPDGYYRSGRELRAELQREAGLSEETPEVDREVRRRALAQIIGHPLRHLAVTLPIAWRGSFPEYGLRTIAPKKLKLRAPLIFSAVYAFSFLALLLWSVRRRRWELFALLSPALYLVAMNALMTHNIHRYNVALIPILAVCAAVMAGRVMWFFSGRRASTPTRASARHG